ncbi:hypothetical protein BU26DRAFT_520196 [Trematosphaeria pertusa]|uniref:Uncharacterized protein n=1 Tax=Trematosphaeria pertusa TaxID=390896 RepID=A0A6A6IE81_9PLEO|nr:uncharacterized protein BU26DRAFT_520196 [Trematosphaeria pertusa]KAF2248517.1 hypothetical protein BU26DRAFT_520196 [Trematosphaeria pertusa]
MPQSVDQRHHHRTLDPPVQQTEVSQTLSHPPHTTLPAPPNNNDQTPPHSHHRTPQAGHAATALGLKTTPVVTSRL